MPTNTGEETNFVDGDVASVTRKRKGADTIGKVLVPSAGQFQCYNKTYGSNFIKQGSKTVMV